LQRGQIDGPPLSHRFTQLKSANLVSGVNAENLLSPIYGVWVAKKLKS
jgi:hypothetical protein